jgi:chromosome segregation ATPase
MAQPGPPSAALVRTARSEIERIDRSVATLEQRRAALQSQLAELDAETKSYMRRRRLLEELVDLETPHSGGASPKGPAARRLVKGSELRQIAGRLLWAAQEDREIHYREWFERVIAAGYAVGGKDPVASFLTNVRDSPAVVRGSAQGRYRLDAGAVARVGQEIAEVEAELADVEQSISRSYRVNDETPVAAMREHRDGLSQRLKRLEATRAELRGVFEHVDSKAISAVR